MRLFRNERFTAVSLSLWAVVVLVCFLALVRESTRPGITSSKADWPAGSTLARLPGRPTLMLFLHPRCPCSEATLNELARGLNGYVADASLHIVFAVPSNADQNWRSGSLIDQAKDITGAHLDFDEGGVESARFGAHVSGQAMLFDAAGKILFSGGITPSRGHEGQTIGRDLIQQVMVDHIEPAESVRSPVFGCALYVPKEPAEALTLSNP